MTLVIGFAPRNPNSVHYGGTMTILMGATTTLKKVLDETSDITWATYTFEGDLELEFASVYAPSKAIHRVDFFTRIEKHLSKHTMAGGDWNCVSDVTLDDNRAKTLWGTPTLEPEYWPPKWNPWD